MSSAGTPEARMLSAVLALAIKDLSLKPIKTVGGHVPRDEALSAAAFLFTDVCHGYLMWLDIEPFFFKEKLLRMMENRKDIDIGGFDAMHRRNMKYNYLNWRENYDRLGTAILECESEYC